MFVRIEYRALRVISIFHMERMQKQS